MARCDVHANPGGTGYVPDVQADVLHELNTRIVVPLLPSAQAPLPAKRPNPIFCYRGRTPRHGLSVHGGSSP
ncbi:CcdB family protein [Shinella sp.]|uniref:CcdB family protein n=1 Tax=Shinella sp. TaxID=1870904 RepID=UPI003F71A82D